MQGKLCMTENYLAFFKQYYLINNSLLCIITGAACVIALDDASQWPEDPPIILDMNDEFVLPEGDYNLDDRTITIAEGDSIKLACSERSFLDSSLDGAEYATARWCQFKMCHILMSPLMQCCYRCVGDQEFGVVTPSNSDETMLDFIELGCDNQPRDASMETGTMCLTNLRSKLIYTLNRSELWPKQQGDRNSAWISDWGCLCTFNQCLLWWSRGQNLLHQAWLENSKHCQRHWKWQTQLWRWWLLWVWCWWCLQPRHPAHHHWYSDWWLGSWLRWPLIQQILGQRPLFPKFWSDLCFPSSKLYSKYNYKNKKIFKFYYRMQHIILLMLARNGNVLMLAIG